MKDKILNLITHNIQKPVYTGTVDKLSPYHKLHTYSINLAKNEIDIENFRNIGIDFYDVLAESAVMSIFQNIETIITNVLSEKRFPLIADFEQCLSITERFSTVLLTPRTALYIYIPIITSMGGKEIGEPVQVLKLISVAEFKNTNFVINPYLDWNNELLYCFTKPIFDWTKFIDSIEIEETEENLLIRFQLNLLDSDEIITYQFNQEISNFNLKNNKSKVK